MSSFTSLPDVPTCTKCNSCKALFTSIEIVKEHYKSDWHVFNSKRRANNLAPLSLADFKKVSPSIKKPASASLKRPETTAERKIINISGKESETSKPKPELASELASLALRLGVKPERVENVLSLALSESIDYPIEDSENEQKALEHEDTHDREEHDTIVSATSSIFDNKQFDNIEECLNYMELTFGFFIPDREYVVDLEGMLTYLGEKVKLGGICLYCQKQLRPGRSCQNHMMNKSHCKIAYEDDIDIDEYEDFYDFSSSYEDDELDEDGESLVSRTLEISPVTGELVLLDGRTVGHRNLNVYYKQHFKPLDDRPSILAQKREELLRLEAMFGALKMDPTSIERLSDVQVVALIRKEHREQRKQLAISQRQEQRIRFKDQKREYQSNTDALRSSQNTTAKIRDYHSRLV